MLSIYSSYNVNANSSVEPDLKLDEVESSVFSFIREACARMSSKPVARVAGGWVRDKLLNKQSKDIDITVDNMKGTDFAQALRDYSLRPEVVHRYGQKFVGSVKGTEARPEQIKNLAVAFVRINGQDVEILPLRGLEKYQKGNRNPITINFFELQNIAKTTGIPNFVKQEFPEFYNRINSMPPGDQNDPAKVMPMLDAHRRDLTINSLFYNLSTGQIEDQVGDTNRRLGIDVSSMDDLATLTLRTPIDPVKTFTDDPLRLLRVLRFHSKYANSRISPEVIEAMKNPDVQHQIVRRIVNAKETEGIVVERTAIELRKMLQGAQPEAALRIMYETGLLSKMLNLPSGFHPLEMDQRNQWHAMSVINHTLQVLKNVNRLSKQHGFTDEQRMMMNFASLFHDLGKLDPRSHKNKPDGTRGYSGDPNNPQGVPHQQASHDLWTGFAQALQLTNDEDAFIGDLVAGHMKPHDHVERNANPTDKALRRYLRENPNWVFQYVHAMADAMSKDMSDPPQERIDPYRQNMERLRNLAPNADTFGNHPASQDILNGQEIMRIVGLPPKPPAGMKGYIEVVKEKIRDAQDGDPNLNKLQATQIVQSMLSSGELDAYKNV